MAIKNKASIIAAYAEFARTNMLLQQREAAARARWGYPPAMFNAAHEPVSAWRHAAMANFAPATSVDDHSRALMSFTTEGRAITGRDFNTCRARAMWAKRRAAL